jgi:hypothetical protein
LPDHPRTALKALKRALQEIPGSDRWYGTMPKECMTAWIMETTGLEEVIATEEMKAKEEEKGKKKKKKKRERKKKGQKCGTMPTH